jgi:hypothetical protein
VERHFVRSFDVVALSDIGTSVAIMTSLVTVTERPKEPKEPENIDLPCFGPFDVFGPSVIGALSGVKASGVKGSTSVTGRANTDGSDSRSDVVLLGPHKKSPSRR